MKIKPILYGKIYNNDVMWNDPDSLKKLLEGIGEGEDIQILIEKRKHNRSNHQNRYYWGVIIPILCETFGWIDSQGAEEMHEYLKSKFLAVKRGEIWTSRSSSSLTTVEFEEYTKHIREWASLEHSTYIPEPNEPSIQSIYTT